jgi:transposase
MIAADELLAHARGKALIGDTGYDSNRFRQAVRDQGMKPVINSKPERPRKLPVIRKLYRARFRIEVFFHNLKRLRAIATATRRPRATTSHSYSSPALAYGSRTRDTP